MGKDFEKKIKDLEDDKEVRTKLEKSLSQKYWSFLNYKYNYFAPLSINLFSACECFYAIYSLSEF